jgi:AcrR family transcriptional regulator
MAPVAEKPLRADARRNREKVLQAARAVFAEKGVDAQIDDVARRADVGVGTVYRHFPTKEALLIALSDAVFEDVAGFAREAAAMDDAWEGFLKVMWYGAQRTAGDRAFAEILAVQGGGPPHLCPAKDELNAVGAELMRRAQEAGRMRPDVVIEDVGLFMCGIGNATGMPHPCEAPWRRHLSIILDGLRAEAASHELPC